MSKMTQEERNAIVRKRMLDLQKMTVLPMPPDSPFVKPLRLFYTQDGREKIWDIIRTHDAVYIIIFNITRKKLIFVRQFRPSVYFAAAQEKLDEIDVKKYPATLGLALELCAGIVDKKISLVEIAREEVIEECGYEAPNSAFEKVNSYRSGVGDTSSTQTLFYVEVTDDMLTHPDSEQPATSTTSPHSRLVELNYG
ncbi:uridine diphosphate glucose pyrophosphatase NUDT14-like isoform X2 [Belonocnema kinseyi]|uniref:uridine diphosphate glucose pyrophosphatase NUDT14-like isoform X2 n=1 Tax=Belonocnema kinseyi TaxID=2817044 RepID=UPI00143DA7AE|nr:uridine diphosphate glucose pyrophosphatase NUDT14-like isoform X2 [Belonocnema kinseyi]